MAFGVSDKMRHNPTSLNYKQLVSETGGEGVILFMNRATIDR